MHSVRAEQDRIYTWLQEKHKRNTRRALRTHTYAASRHRHYSKYTSWPGPQETSDQVPAVIEIGKARLGDAQRKSKGRASKGGSLYVTSHTIHQNTTYNLSSRDDREATFL